MLRWVQTFCALIAVSLVMGGAGLAAVMLERVEGIGHLTRDTTALAGVPWWTGAVSRLTNLCWAVAATANILSAREARPSLRWPLLMLGLLCVAFAIDDTLLVHDSVIPGLGVSENLVLGGYAIAGLVLGWWWLRASGDTGVRSAFFVGAAMLAVSLAADVRVNRFFGFEDWSGSTMLVIEDGAKLLGVTAWCFCGVWAHRDDAVSGSSTTTRIEQRNG